MKVMIFIFSQPTKPVVSSSSSSFDSLLGDFSNVFAPSSFQNSSNTNLVDDFFASPSDKHGVSSPHAFDKTDALSISLEGAGVFSHTESLATKSSLALLSTETKPTQSLSASISFDGIGMLGLEDTSRTESSRSSSAFNSAAATSQAEKDILVDLDGKTSSAPSTAKLQDLTSQAWSPTILTSTVASESVGVNAILDLLGSSLTEGNKRKQVVTGDPYTDNDLFGGNDISESKTEDISINQQDFKSGNTEHSVKSSVIGLPHGASLDWGFEDFGKTPTSVSSHPLVDDFEAVFGNTSSHGLAVGGTTSSQGNLFDVMDGWDDGQKLSPASTKSTLKSSMSLPDILALENDAMSDLFETDNTLSLVKNPNILISTSQMSSDVQVNLTKPKIGSKRAPVPPIAPSVAPPISPPVAPSVAKRFFGRGKKKTVREIPNYPPFPVSSSPCPHFCPQCFTTDLPTIYYIYLSAKLSRFYI